MTSGEWVGTWVGIIEVKSEKVWEMWRRIFSMFLMPCTVLIFKFGRRTFFIIRFNGKQKSYIQNLLNLKTESAKLGETYVVYITNKKRRDFFQGFQRLHIAIIFKFGRIVPETFFVIWFNFNKTGNPQNWSNFKIEGVTFGKTCEVIKENNSELYKQIYLFVIWFNYCGKNPQPMWSMRRLDIRQHVHCWRNDNHTALIFFAISYIILAFKPEYRVRCNFINILQYW